jgi:hypothetical protein
LWFQVSSGSRNRCKKIGGWVMAGGWESWVTPVFYKRRLEY